MKRRYVTAGQLEGKDIKAARLSLGMTQQEFADLVNVSKKTVERWESGASPVTGPVDLVIKLLGIYPDVVERVTVPEKAYPLRLWYCEGNDVCAIIDVDDVKRLIKVYNFNYDYTKLPFGRNDKPAYEDYEEFLESRCFPRTRDKIKIELDRLGLPFYDPMMIIRKTEGRLTDDEFRIIVE
ncbi:putative transcriptional regulator [Ruminococcaceae bacterium YRB3002]|nr:putative transcriptional regulator [Ruminococcaceae bacterium YRB3002]